MSRLGAHLLSISRTILSAALVLLLAASVHAQSAAKNAYDLDGHPFDPFRAAPGKTVVLLFIRTDCPISNRYAPAIQELSTVNSAHAAFFLVYPTPSESAQQIRKHLRDFKYKIPALRDPELALVRESRVTITPEAAVFSADRRLLYRGRIDNWYVDFGRARPAPTTHELADAVAAASSGTPIANAAVPAVGCFIPGVS